MCRKNNLNLRIKTEFVTTGERMQWIFSLESRSIPLLQTWQALLLCDYSDYFRPSTVLQNSICFDVLLQDRSSKQMEMRLMGREVPLMNQTLISQQTEKLIITNFKQILDFRTRFSYTRFSYTQAIQNSQYYADGTESVENHLNFFKLKICNG